MEALASKVGCHYGVEVVCLHSTILRFWCFGPCAENSDTHCWSCPETARCEEVLGKSDRLRYWGLLIYGATLGVRTPCGLAFEDERVEGRAFVRVYILDPAALATSSQALVSFWPYGDVQAGYVIIVLANLLEPGMSVAR